MSLGFSALGELAAGIETGADVAAGVVSAGALGANEKVGFVSGAEDSVAGLAAGAKEKAGFDSTLASVAAAAGGGVLGAKENPVEEAEGDGVAATPKPNPVPVEGDLAGAAAPKPNPVEDPPAKAPKPPAPVDFGNAAEEPDGAKEKAGLVGAAGSGVGDLGASVPSDSAPESSESSFDSSSELSSSCSASSSSSSLGDSLVESPSAVTGLEGVAEIFCSSSFAAGVDFGAANAPKPPAVPPKPNADPLGFFSSVAAEDLAGVEAKEKAGRGGAGAGAGEVEASSFAGVDGVSFVFGSSALETDAAGADGFAVVSGVLGANENVGFGCSSPPSFLAANPANPPPADIPNAEVAGLSISCDADFSTCLGC